MRDIWVKSGDNYLPAIVHADGRREVIGLTPLVTRKRAKFYARCVIAEREEAARRKIRILDIKAGV